MESAAPRYLQPPCIVCTLSCRHRYKEFHRTCTTRLANTKQNEKTNTTFYGMCNKTLATTTTKSQNNNRKESHIKLSYESTIQIVVRYIKSNR